MQGELEAVPMPGSVSVFLGNLEGHLLWNAWLWASLGVVGWGGGSQLCTETSKLGGNGAGVCDSVDPFQWELARSQIHSIQGNFPSSSITEPHGGDGVGVSLTTLS